jgi:hypothetical protein
LATFTDQLGREWKLSLTVLDLKKLKTEFALDLAEFAAAQSPAFARLSSDPVLLVDVLSCLLQEQLTKLGLDERQFVAGFVGEGIERATEALIEAIANFSKPQEGRVIRAIWNKVQATRDLATQRVLDRMDSIDLPRLVETKLGGALEQLPLKSGD